MAKKKESQFDKDFKAGWNAAWEMIFGRSYSTRKTFPITPQTKWPEYWRDLGFVNIPKDVQAKRKREAKKRREKRRRYLK